MNEQPRSYAGLISAIVGIVALLARAHAADPAPLWAWVRALASDVPSMTAILGYVIPAAAIVVGSVTHPAHWLRDPILTAFRKVRAFVASFVPRGTP